LVELANIEATLVLLESPRRLASALADMTLVLGPRRAAVARELTKLYEEVRRGRLDELARTYAGEETPKGEIVIVVAPPEGPAREIDIEALLKTALEGHSVKEATALVTAQTGLPRKTVYAQALILAKAR
jgi:16S rRNA (cytidine1402-2'-O)-methyltransferase